MSLIQFSTGTGFQKRFINDSASNTVTNSTSETVLDQYFSMPPDSSWPLYVGTTLRMTALGTISTGLISLGFRFRLRLGGLGGAILCDTGGLTILTSLTNSGWMAQSIVTVRDLGASGAVEAQNYASLQTGTLLAMPATTTVAMDTTVANDFTYTAQWSTATANNQFTMRSIFIEALSPAN